MSKLKFIAVVLIFVLAVGITGCGKKSSSGEVKEHFSKEQSMDFETANREKVRVCLDDSSGYSLSRTSSTFIIRDADGKELVSGLFGNLSMLPGYKVAIEHDGENCEILEDSVLEVQPEDETNESKDSKKSEDKNKEKSEDKTKKDSEDKDKVSKHKKGYSPVEGGDFEQQVLVWTEKVGQTTIINRAESISNKSIVAMYSSLSDEEFNEVLKNMYIMIIN